jgi:ABC-type multidrug transport system fused ATPase/permease subunit
MRQFGQIVNDYQYAEAAGERIVGLLDTEPGVTDAPDAVDLGAVEGRVEYDDVQFTYETEAVIQNSLADLIADRTAFAIAHRLSTVRDADQILVMDEGELVEQGTHEDLLAEDGLYATLWRVQVGAVDALPEEFLERAAGQSPRTGQLD